MAAPLARLDHRLSWRQVRALPALLAAGMLRTWRPAHWGVGARMPLDVIETDQAYLITVELAGCTREDIQVAIDETRVTLSVNANAAEDIDGGRRIYGERAHGPRSRTIYLAHAVDKENAHGACRDGLLTLHLPKQTDERGASPDPD